MRSKKVTRHYCDFCDRGFFYRPQIERHEKSCVKNPQRVCSICECENTDEGIAVLQSKGLEGLMDSGTGDCHACVLAAVVQFNAIETDVEKHVYDLDYKDYYKQRERYIKGEKWKIL